MRTMINKVKSLYTSGGIHIIIGTFLTKFISLFSSIILVRVFAKNDFGTLSFIDNIYGYFYILAGYGLSKALVRYIVLGKDEKEKSAIFYYAIKSGSIFNFIIICIGCVISYFYVNASTFSDSFWLVIISIFQVEFNFVIYSVLYTERALFETKRYALLSFFVSAAVVLVKLFGGVINGVTGAVIALTLFEGIVAIILYIVDGRRYFSRGTKANKQLKKELNLFAIQCMITDGLWSIFMLNDTFLLGHISGDAVVLAEYKVACVLPAQLSIIASAIGMFIEPYFTKKYQEGNLTWVKKNWLKTLLITFGFVAICTVILILFGDFIIHFIYGEKYENIGNLMKLLCIAYLLNAGLRYTTANILSAIGEIKYNLIVSIVGIVIQIIIDVLVIPQYGAYGVAVSNIIVYLVMALFVNMIFASKIWRKSGKERC